MQRFVPQRRAHRDPEATPHRVSRRGVLAAGAALGAGLALGPTGTAARAQGRTGAGEPWPTTLRLPDGFRPEGIAVGRFEHLYFGSLANGAIHRIAPDTGQGDEVFAGTGAPAVGLKIDWQNRLFIAGGSSRELRVVSTSGGLLGVCTVGGPGTFVNDVVGTGYGNFFTDSFKPQLYLWPYGSHGELPPPGAVVTLPLTGEWVQGADFTANGITHAPDGNLLVVNAAVGALYWVDRRTGHSRRLIHQGPPLVNGDGLLSRGGYVYVVQQRQNTVDVLKVNKGLTRTRTVGRITDPRFDIPTTVAPAGGRLYLPNARFSTEPTPTTPYTVVAVEEFRPRR